MQKTLLRALASTTIAAFMLPAALATWCHFTYYDELDDIRELLAALPGVSVLESGGNEDITLEDIYATVAIKDKGTLSILGLTRSSFSSVDYLHISRVGDLEPRIAGCGQMGVRKIASGERVPSRFWSSSVNVGPAGDVAPALSGGINSVPEAIGRYEEIEALLSTWPVCPESSLRETAERWYRFCASPVGADLWPRSSPGPPGSSQGCGEPAAQQDAAAGRQGPRSDRPR